MKTVKRIHPADEVITWLLDGDPSIRWQVQRDLLEAPRKTWAVERERVATDGWGAQLLERQDRAGTWGGGIYTPKWISTTYTLLQLREMGLAPGNEAAVKGCTLILDRSRALKSATKDIKSVAGAGCTCMIGMYLALPCYFGIDDDERLAPMAKYLLTQQLPDGGWNCRLRNGRGAVHGSFHTTFNVLDGVREAIARRIGPTNELRAAEARAIEFMLMHRLYKSDKTGRVIKDVFTKLSFPPRWHYDVIRGLDYIRTTDAIHDPRLADAFELLKKKRTPDGRWLLEHKYGGQVFFNMEPLGKPSRWNTLRVMRCLKARES